MSSAVSGGDHPLPAAPITELSNELTENIDSVDSRGLVRLLRGTDSQIFNGWQHHTSLLDPSVLSAVERTVSAVVEALRDDAPHYNQNTIVMTGSGTSGRIAYFVARAFNSMLQAVTGVKNARPFQYLISGGDTALLESEELPEDDPLTGAKQLDALCSGKRNVILIGITCGLSAPYVAGQLDWAMNRDAAKPDAKHQSKPKTKTTTVLMGFNPLSLARRAPIEIWKQSGRTFYDVATALAAKSDAQHIVLNPIVGPEPVTGSSRMKGGSTTKILLETIFTLAMSRVFPQRVGLTRSLASTAAATAATASAASSPAAFDLISLYQTTHLVTYAESDAIAAVVEFGTNSLRAGGHIFYIGGEPDSSAAAAAAAAGASGTSSASAACAVMGFIDASEMPDTFGTPHTDVRAFVRGGWTTIAAASGDLTHHSSLFRIGIEHFESDILPTLSDRDSVIVISNRARALIDPHLLRLAAAAKQKLAKVALISVTAALQSASSANGAGLASVAIASTATTPLQSPVASPVTSPVPIAHAATAAAAASSAAAAGNNKRTFSGGGASPKQCKESSAASSASAATSTGAAAPASSVAGGDDSGRLLKKHKTDLFSPPARTDSKVYDTVFDAIVAVVLPAAGLSHDTGSGSGVSAVRYECSALLSMSTKWILNAITTGANVGNGTVLANRMINMTVANNKLFHRSIGIIRDSVRISLAGGRAGFDDSDAAIQTALLRAIYETDTIDSKITSLPTSAHIITATKGVKVLPLAILLASGRFASVAVARAALAKDGNVRTIIKHLPPQATAAAAAASKSKH